MPTYKVSVSYIIDAHSKEEALDTFEVLWLDEDDDQPTVELYDEEVPF